MKREREKEMEEGPRMSKKTFQSAKRALPFLGKSYIYSAPSNS
jgi:hypothetical protein